MIMTIMTLSAASGNAAPQHVRYTTVTHPDSGSLRARLVVRGRVNDDLRNDDSARGMMSPQNVGDGEPNDDLVGG
jgi:surfactin synthase thioesterase subunit